MVGQLLRRRLSDNSRPPPSFRNLLLSTELFPPLHRRGMLIDPREGFGNPCRGYHGAGTIDQLFDAGYFAVELEAGG